MWVRPGKLGEYIPQKLMADHSCKFYKKADCDFRGECIEGAPSLENVVETVEFLPKINANLFMMEYIVPFNYISRWTMHEKILIKRMKALPLRRPENWFIRSRWPSRNADFSFIPWGMTTSLNLTAYPIAPERTLITPQTPPPAVTA